MKLDLLDDDLHQTKAEDQPHRLELLTQYLEIIPLIIFTLGVYLQYKGIDYWKPLILIGGTLSVLIYTAFSFILYRLGKYSGLELGLSLMATVLFPIGISETFLDGKLPYFPFLEYGLYGCTAMMVISGIFLILCHKDKRASVFHQGLIARLMVISTVLFIFNY